MATIKARRDAAGQFRKAMTITEWVGAVLRRRARNRRLDARERVLLPGGGWREGVMADNHYPHYRSVANAEAETSERRW